MELWALSETFEGCLKVNRNLKDKLRKCSSEASRCVCVPVRVCERVLVFEDQFWICKDRKMEESVM